MNPLFRALLGPELGLATIGDGRPDNSSGDLSALTKAYAEARRQKQGVRDMHLFAPPTFPQTTAPVPAGLPAAPQAPAPAPPPAVASAGGPSPMDNAQWPFGPNGAPSAAQAQAPAPMPQPRPAEAPAAPPEMSFFQRNAAMMRDPMTGDFLDPQAGKQADATGPDLIQKFMNYFHNKA